MAFNSYLTFEEYISFGGTVSEDAFPLLERKAQRLLDRITFDRIPHLTMIPDVVKEVLTEFINKMQAQLNISGNGTGITKYSNGVETLEFTANVEQKLQSELTRLANNWLPDYLVARSVNFDVDKYLQSENNNPQ